LQGGEENTYGICVTHAEFTFTAPDNPVVFRSAHQGLPLPNPAYLKIHAACCRVAHLSGAGEYMEKISEDMEDMQVLSKDGSSAYLLSYALQPHGQEVVVL